jgi:hypothetical protein
MEHNYTSPEYAGYLFAQGILWPRFTAFWSHGPTFNVSAYMSVVYEADGISITPAYTATELKFCIGGQFQQNPRLKAPVMNSENRLIHFNIWEVYYPTQMATYKTEADAAAAWLIYLISKQQVRVSEINERLARLQQ